MDDTIKNFLQFNGRNIYFKSENGTYYIAVKPICEALNVNYNRQFQNIKNHPILNQIFAIQQIVAADGKIRKMVCLPEFNVYGWLFLINSKSPELLKYQWKCYEILFNHFHGTITRRSELLRLQYENDNRIAELTEKEKESESYKNIQQLKEKNKNIRKSLSEMDKDLATGQLNIFNN